MFWFPDWGWVAWLLNSLFWIGVVVAGVVLLQREFSGHGRSSDPSPSALRILEERYASGEITREEFLERRATLLSTAASADATPTTDAPPVPAPPPAPPPEPPPPPPASEAGSEDRTQPIPRAPTEPA